MKRIPVIHLARILRVLVIAVLAMNILCLLLRTVDDGIAICFCRRL